MVYLSHGGPEDTDEPQAWPDLDPRRSPGAKQPWGTVLEHTHRDGHRARISATLTAMFGCYTNCGDWTMDHNQFFTGEKQAEPQTFAIRKGTL